MRIEKQGSKDEGGRGFHHLFDRNSKSTKKLVSKIPDLSVQPKQKTSIDTNTQITQYNPVIEDYTASSIILKGCTSSLIDEDDNGKSPGVVARLMGLDSFPNSNLFDTQSKSYRFFGTRSSQVSSAVHVRKVPEHAQKDHHQFEQKHKIIEKFQTESLPPKSARTVPFTQHKLLSPIKSSRFISLNDPNHIMEATSKIPLVVPSLVDFSNRKPSSTKPVESNAARKLKGQSMNKSWDGCLEQKEGKKSVSLAIQAKVNVKKREGLTLNGAKSTNNQPIDEKNTLKKPATNRVLKQNNKKQNCVPDKGKSAAKSSMNTQSRKPVSGKSMTVTPVSKTVDRAKRFTQDVKNKGCAKQDRSGKNAAKSNGLDVISFTFTSPMSRSMDRINGNNFNSATVGGSLSTLLDQQLRKLTAMSPASIFQESRITRTIIFQDSRNCDRTNKDAQVAGQEFDAVFSKKSTKTDVDTERGYIKNILSNIESMFEDFTLNRSSKIVNPHLFAQLEAQKPAFHKKHTTKLRRKLVFDCVSECVDSRCAVWLRGLAVVRRKDQLVEQVCNKINEWEQMKDCMVDGLVDKDMSSGQYKKWLDFDFEAFEIGVEIEGRLLRYLIDEAIVDMLLS